MINGSVYVEKKLKVKNIKPTLSTVLRKNEVKILLQVRTLMSVGVFMSLIFF